MGMAASQARFLGLTARKNNVEFEGQQINQQRTNLANQTANYYNDLLGMKVPTPPSVDNFTKTVYSFNDGALTNQITALIAQGGGAGYKVSYLQQHEDDFTPVKDGMAVITKNGTDYNIGNVVLRTMFAADKDFTSEADFVGADVDTDPDDPGYGKVEIDELTSYEGEDEYLKSLSIEQLQGLLEEEARYVALLNDKYGPPTDGWAVRYVENTTTGEMEPKFYNMDEVKGANYDTNGISLSSITAYKIGSATVTEEIKNVDAQLEKDSTGRYINITLTPAGGTPVTYSLTTSTVTDQAAYDDAMNQYEFDKHQYEQQIQEINAKIEIIQAQDKNLELRLKQLDTEQDAISQEMEAVSSVVQKNVESTFKTFA